MKPEDFYHLKYDLSLGKCNMSLRSWLILNLHIQEILDAMSIICVCHKGRIDPKGRICYKGHVCRVEHVLPFLKCYNQLYLTVDGHLYNNPEDHLVLASIYGDINIFHKYSEHIKNEYYEVESWLRPLVVNKQRDIMYLLISYNHRFLNAFLYEAVNVGNLKLVKKLIDQGADDLNYSFYLANRKKRKLKHIIAYLQSIM